MNSTTANKAVNLPISAYYSLVLTVLGTLLNTLTLIVLCRSTFRNTRTRPTIHYMRTIAVFDILMLYGWNLDHYLSAVRGFSLQRLTIASCRFLSFLNYFSCQSSAWLRVFVCLDRYLSISRIHQTWFTQSKSVLVIITSIIVAFTLLNLYFFFVACSYQADGSITVQSAPFDIYPLWDYVNLAVYNCVPFLFMIIFNSGVCFHLFTMDRRNITQHFRLKQRSITIALAIMTCLFFIMTVPATVAFAFFYAADKGLLQFLDDCLYSYHTISGILYFITFGEFRRVCIALFIGRKRRRTAVAPLRQLPYTWQAGGSRREEASAGLTMLFINSRFFWCAELVFQWKSVLNKLRWLLRNCLSSSAIRHWSGARIEKQEYPFLRAAMAHLNKSLSPPKGLMWLAASDIEQNEDDLSGMFKSIFQRKKTNYNRLSFYK